MKAFSQESLLRDEKQQDRIVLWGIVSSVVVHLLIFWLIQVMDLIRLPTPMIEEWSIDTELISDINVGASTQTVIPGAKESDEVSVPSNLLPQLTKKFTTKERPKEEEGLEDGPIEPEVEKGKNLSKDTDKDSPAVEPDPEINTRLEKQEALKRMALEKLRKEQKEKSTELKAHKDDKLARLREALHDGAALDSNVGGLMASAESRRYQNYLIKAIRRNYALPQTYKFKNANIHVVLLMRISARGELLAVDIQDSSGDPVLDTYCIEAVKRSAPFEAPPKALAGQDIGLKFKP